MFGGSFNHKLDEVGRFIVPKKFRFSLGERFVITRGLGCLLVLTTERFELIKAQAQGLGNPMMMLFNPEIGRLYRHLFGEMVETSCDGQGRIQLTPELRAHAGIDKDLVMVGVGEWCELWGTDNWEAYKNDNLTPEQLIKAAAAALGSKEGGEGSDGVPSAGSAL